MSSSSSIEVIGAVPLKRLTVWTVRMADRQRNVEIWVGFGMDVTDEPGLIRVFPIRVGVQVVDQAPPDAYIDTSKVASFETEAWVKRAFVHVRKKMQTREDYLTLWGDPVRRIRPVLAPPGVAL